VIAHLPDLSPVKTKIENREKRVVYGHRPLHRAADAKMEVREKRCCLLPAHPLPGRWSADEGKEEAPLRRAAEAKMKVEARGALCGVGRWGLAG